MKEYRREFPAFSLCGLNCGLCPRYHTSGGSRCPGCGGSEFHLKHPSCAVITCNNRLDQVEFCFQCSSYPCARFEKPSPKDSFITYRNVLSDFQKTAHGGLASYRRDLTEKMRILEYLLGHCDDGRKKSFYCLAVNLLPIKPL